MKFDSLFNTVMKSRFLIESPEDETVTPELGATTAPEKAGIQDEIDHQEAVEDAIISYLKSLKDNKTTFGDLRNYVSRLSIVEDADDAKYHVIAALKNLDSLNIEREKGVPINDTNVITFAEDMGDENEDVSDAKFKELESDEDDIFSSEDRAGQAIQAHLPKDAIRDYEQSKADPSGGGYGDSY